MFKFILQKTNGLINSNKSKNAESPYLQVESSSFGMMPLRTLPNNSPAVEKRKLTTDSKQVINFIYVKLCSIILKLFVIYFSILYSRNLV